MNNIWNTLNGPTKVVPFIVFLKSLFALLQVSKHTLCIIQYSESNSRVILLFT